ncbi:DUF6261 family protein [Tenacibaculum amylolyticum]|uniref:DUF6261 family protein n=1 Tax=Tenacibaculum amylolyticum TaxID=104269 RepID=UPI003892EAF2
MVSPYLNRYRNAEYLQYMKDIVKLVNQQDVAALSLTEPRDALADFITAIEAAYQQEQGSAITQEIIALDEERDKAFIGIKTVVTGYTYRKDATIANAAQTVLNAMLVYGTQVTRKSYQEETAIIDSFIDDIEIKPTITAAIATLNLQDWVADLKTANETFSQKYIERIGETAANTASIPNLRTNTTVAYRELISHIEAHKTLTKNVVYTGVLNEIDVLAKQYNLVVDNRVGGNGAEVPGSTNEIPTDVNSIEEE